MREQLSELQVQGELLREEQQRDTGLESQLITNEQELTTTREQLSELQVQGELLREEQQRVTYEQELIMIKMREQLRELQRQGELSTREQQRVTDDKKRAEVITMGQRLSTFTRPGCHVAPKQQRNRVLESQLRSRDQEISQLRDQLREARQSSARAPSSDWVINRNEIQIDTEHELGRGTWGIVYRGKFHGCDVAVKEMYENIMSRETRRVFYREISMAAKCRHPCLLQFIGTTTDERPLFVSEIMECSLRERLYPKQYNRDDDFSPAEVPVISLDVARALNYLHQKPKPILHHDISSGNVLLWRQDNHWRAKVSDYGTANFVRQNTTNYAGAVIYCAPESMIEDRDRPISVKVSTYPSRKRYQWRYGVLIAIPRSIPRRHHFSLLKSLVSVKMQKKKKYS